MPLFDLVSSITDALLKYGIIPDVIPAELRFQPSTLFTVTWGEQEVMLGNELQLSHTADEPRITLAPMGSIDEEGETYTIAMVDPDAPSREDHKFGPFRHWILSGLKPPTTEEIEAAASSPKELLAAPSDPLSALSAQPSITPYRAPAPGPGTGAHRYTFLLFKEPIGGVKIPEDAPERESALEQRRNWFASQFAQRYGLTLVGANFFILNSD